jgi:capsule polysaccharide modification protein KpsS
MSYMERFPTGQLGVIFLAIAVLTASARQLEAQEDIPQITPEEAAQLQKKLQTDPGNLEAHTKLLFHYRFDSEREFVEQLIWFIDHHPDSQIEWILRTHRQPISRANLTRLRSEW